MDITADDLIDERPTRGLFKDPAAVPVWAGILTLDEATQHEVPAELRVRLVSFDERQGDLNKRRAKAIAALRQAASRLGGKSPTITEYRRLHAENPGLDWPTDGSVRRALGAGQTDESWNTALEQAHLDAVSEPMAAEPALGPEMTDEELITALQQCAKDLGETPTSTAYMQWARRPDVTRRPGRRPRSIGAFQRAFEKWTDAVSAAGLEPSEARLRPQYSDGYLFRSFDEVRRRNNGRMPSRSEFSSIRRQIIVEREAAAVATSATGATEPVEKRAFPTDATCLIRAGGWVKFGESYKEWKAAKDPDYHGE
jgi:hypothetical protein